MTRRAKTIEWVEPVEDKGFATRVAGTIERLDKVVEVHNRAIDLFEIFEQRAEQVSASRDAVIECSPRYHESMSGEYYPIVRIELRDGEKVGKFAFPVAKFIDHSAEYTRSGRRTRRIATLNRAVMLDHMGGVYGLIYDASSNLDGIERISLPTVALKGTRQLDQQVLLPGFKSGDDYFYFSSRAIQKEGTQLTVLLETLEVGENFRLWQDVVQEMENVVGKTPTISKFFKTDK